jgi:predicted small secreted protein
MKTSQILASVTVVCALFLASCANTVRGVGADVKQTANAVEDVVE